MKFYFKKKNILALILLALAFSCNVKNDRSLISSSNEERISDSLIYGFINYLVDHPELNSDIKSRIIGDQELKMPFPFVFKKDSVELTKLSQFLSLKDVKYIFSQKKQFETFILNPDSIHHKKVITYDSIPNHNSSYSTISFPLFNIDKTVVIIRTSYSDCPTCSVGGVYIYEKRNSKWFLIKRIQGWIS